MRRIEGELQKVKEDSQKTIKELRKENQELKIEVGSFHMHCEEMLEVEMASLPFPMQIERLRRVGVSVCVCACVCAYVCEVYMHHVCMLFAHSGIEILALLQVQSQETEEVG